MVLCACALCTQGDCERIPEFEQVCLVPGEGVVLCACAVCTQGDCEGRRTVLALMLLLSPGPQPPLAWGSALTILAHALLQRALSEFALNLSPSSSSLAPLTTTQPQAPCTGRPGLECAHTRGCHTYACQPALLSGSCPSLSIILMWDPMGQVCVGEGSDSSSAEGKPSS